MMKQNTSKDHRGSAYDWWGGVPFCHVYLSERILITLSCPWRVTTSSCFLLPVLLQSMKCLGRQRGKGSRGTAAERAAWPSPNASGIPSEEPWVGYMPMHSIFKTEKLFYMYDKEKYVGKYSPQFYFLSLSDILFLIPVAKVSIMIFHLSIYNIYSGCWGWGGEPP